MSSKDYTATEFEFHSESKSNPEPIGVNGEVVVARTEKVIYLTALRIEVLERQVNEFFEKNPQAYLNGTIVPIGAGGIVQAIVY
jgi:hypothetical protein